MRNMFAGRYLKWVTWAALIYVFCAFYLYHLGWFLVRLSGCAEAIGGCSDLQRALYDRVHPYGLAIAAALVLAATPLRLFFLRLNPLFYLAFLAWFAASAGFFQSLGNLWFAHTPLNALLGGAPIEALWLAGLIVALCLPLELWPKKPANAVRLARPVMLMLIVYSVAHTLTASPALPAALRHAGAPELALKAAGWQHTLHPWLLPSPTVSLWIGLALALPLGVLRLARVMRQLQEKTATA